MSTATTSTTTTTALLTLSLVAEHRCATHLDLYLEMYNPNKRDNICLSKGLSLRRGGFPTHRLK